MTDKYINSATFYSVEILVEKEGDTTDIQNYERINQFDTQEQAEYFILNMCDKNEVYAIISSVYTYHEETGTPDEDFNSLKIVKVIEVKE